jgi:S1-C subfamily serine protease
MTTRVPVHRRRRRLALAVVLITCFALAGLGARADHTLAAGRTSAAAEDTGVVDITAQLGSQDASAGTGIVISTTGEVLTNNHVIKGARRIEVTVPGGRDYQAQVLGTDPTHDVALLEIGAAPGLAAATLGDSSQTAVGDPVTAIGNAGGVGGTPSVASGTVTALDQSVTATDESGFSSEQLDGLIQTNAPIVPGYSGGPLLNAAGQVIGMDTAAVVSQPEQPPVPPEGYAIPVNSAIAVARTIEATHASAGVNTGSRTAARHRAHKRHAAQRRAHKRRAARHRAQRRRAARPSALSRG